MAKYAVIENNLVINVALADEAFAQSQGWIAIPDGFGIGDSYENGTFVSKPEPSITWEDIRLQRNGLLAETDWRFRSDMTPSQAWKDYCQALRDIPATFANPQDVVWPAKP